MEKTYVYNLGEMFCEDDGRFAAAAAERAEALGVSGDAAATRIAYELLAAENFFTLLAERGKGRGSAREIVLPDIRAVLNEYRARIAAAPVLARYTAGKTGADVAAERTKRLARKLVELSGSPEKFADELISEYERGGAGETGMYAAFAFEDGRLVPQKDFAPKSLDELVGYDEQKRALIANTEAFVAGKSANNVLLYGDAGTGKSTSVKALSRYFGPEKLKIAELRRSDISRVSELFASLRGRAARFILFLDDLSFEADETEYKRFKALVDGGLAARPDNVLLYATSNRAHLVRESLSDRDGQSIDIHRADTVEEKLSLSSRFGLTIFYPSPAHEEYLAIVRSLAKKHGVDMPVAELDRLAVRWATAQHKRSGRTAEQFVRSLVLGYTE